MCIYVCTRTEKVKCLHSSSCFCILLETWRLIYSLELLWFWCLSSINMQSHCNRLLGDEKMHLTSYPDKNNISVNCIYACYMTLTVLWPMKSEVINTDLQTFCYYRTYVSSKYLHTFVLPLITFSIYAFYLSRYTMEWFTCTLICLLLFFFQYIFSVYMYVEKCMYLYMQPYFEKIGDCFLPFITLLSKSHK